MLKKLSIMVSILSLLNVRKTTTSVAAITAIKVTVFGTNTGDKKVRKKPTDFMLSNANAIDINRHNSQSMTTNTSTSAKTLGIS